MDRLSREARSAHMRLIRKVDTKPELRVRQVAHALGFRFRLHRKDLPGTPDVVFPRLRKVILVNGWFWHQHPGCRLARLPKSRLEYWLPKLERNLQRDAEKLLALAEAGWTALVVWECETKDGEALAERLRRFLAAASSEPREPEAGEAGFQVQASPAPSAPAAAQRGDLRIALIPTRVGNGHCQEARTSKPI
jgi:DNA mismatch endonuclease (patch repair protein)